MAKTKAKTKTEKTTEAAPAELARKIWLAGIGAYGRAFEDAQEQWNKLNEDSSEYFDKLVEKGEELETDTQEKIEKFQEEASASVEDRIAKVRETLSSFPGVAGRKDRIAKLEEEVATLKKKVASLTKAPKAKKASSKKAA